MRARIPQSRRRRRVRAENTAAVNKNTHTKRAHDRVRLYREKERDAAAAAANTRRELAKMKSTYAPRRIIMCTVVRDRPEKLRAYN